MNATDNSLGGKYNITGFYAHTLGTFYQSCGNCLNQAKRNATIEKSVALFGTRLGIISPNCMSQHLTGRNTSLSEIRHKTIRLDTRLPIDCNYTFRAKNGLLTTPLRRWR
jgi:hypothetical protein